MTEGINSAIGKTSSTGLQPNSTRTFYCWLEENVIVNPFDFLTAEHIQGSRTTGVVSEILAPTDSLSHLSNYVSSEFGDTNSEPYVDRLSTMVAEVNVLRNDNDPEFKMPVAADRKVYFSTAQDIQKALGADLIKGIPIPAGLIKQSNGITVPIQLDDKYVFGPEGAHVNASGISGLATKTSYLMFLIMSSYQKLSNELAVIMFNVKQSDLLRVHEKAVDLDEQDKKYYEMLGINAEPFKNVKYFLPRGRNGKPDSSATPSPNQIYAYTLADSYADLDLLFADMPDPWFTLDGFTVGARERWDSTRNRLSIGGRDITSWSQLVNNLNQFQDPWTQPPWNIHKGTVGRIRRNLDRLVSSALFPTSRSASEIYLGEEIKKIRAGDVFVVDIAQVSPRTQPLIVGDVMRSLEKMYRGDTENKPPKRLLIFIDELNLFAPAGKESSITEQIIQIAARGRSSGLVLFGAEQFKSQVHDQVAGNASNFAIGRTGSAEIRKTAYAELDDKAKQIAMGLGKGEILLTSPPWRTPIRILFPRPPYRRI